MKVSIVTVSYNSARTIADCIDSVLSQNHPDIEYIVVDGASSDGTAEMVNRYGERISKFLSEPDQGIYDAMNKGLTLCTGDVIGILNSDDFYADDNVISDVVELLEKTNADSCYSDLLYVDREQTDEVVRTWISGEYHPNRFLKGWMPPHPTFFLRRKFYTKYGFFDLTFSTSADYELMLRMLFRHGLTSAYLNRVTIRMRAGGQSNITLHNRLKANREDRRAWKVNGLKAPVYTLMLKPLSKLGQFLKKS
jgi:glycosyltransferase involved in cell wall biosynthesis